jgi:hypothetical protein
MAEPGDAKPLVSFGEASSLRTQDQRAEAANMGLSATNGGKRMTDYSSSKPVSGWTTGFVIFAASIMILIGIFQAISGLAAIFENEFYVVTDNYVFDLDVTAWGWIHLVLGVVILFAGWGIFSGATWARVTGIVLAILAAVANFFFIPYYPIWSIVIIALCIAVIWALAKWDQEVATRA